ncbi:hypothetical protein [Micromonospora sp. WMMA1947]|uniref:hypothetical protein n=1 Tax=Micromonospora sp. WMMA1947 TaxID=3015163 RepID=UPI00248BEBAC|nr:hypothetical protein [Micromonospora sp. WMMA1947]WBC06776.1 hypothetical protein O7604_16120 [Micromonospora sp. WMMA1947]
MVIFSAVVTLFLPQEGIDVHPGWSGYQRKRLASGQRAHRNGSTVLGMQPDPETDEIIAAYAAGQDVDDIARRYGLTREEVWHLASGGDQAQPARQSWRDSKGNRVLLGVAVGWVAWFFAGLLGAEGSPRIILLAVVAAITYAVAAPRR